MRRLRALLATAAVLALTGAMLPGLAAAELAEHETQLVSRSNTGAVGNGYSQIAVPSGDGRYVAFVSNASNLHPDDTADDDVYVRDVQTGTTELVSRNTAGTKSNGHSFAPGLSADGRYVAFTSVATNLHADDTDTVADVYVRDRVTGDTSLISRSSTGAKGNGSSNSPSLTADGRYVAFASIATNLHPDDSDLGSDVYLHDRVGGTTSLISLSNTGANSNGDAVAPEISSDGSAVAFVSRATNLHPDDPDTALDVYVHRMLSQTTALVSRNNGGAKGNADSYGPAMSADGTLIAFPSSSTNLDPADGDDLTDIYLHDSTEGSTALASRATSGAKSDGSSYGPSLSADGTQLAFTSLGANLDPADGDFLFDVFVRDLDEGATTLVSRTSGANGAKGNSHSLFSTISANGENVAFESDASNLAVDDGNNNRDVFVRRIHAAEPPPPPPAENRPPQADDGTTSGTEGRPIEVRVEASDPDGDDLAYEVSEQPGHGTLDGNGPDYTYTSEAGFTGTDTFTADVCDPDDACDTATVTVEVKAFEPPAEPPDDAGELTVDPSTAKAGDVVSVTGSGYEPNETVFLVIYSDPERLATVLADDDGKLAATVTIPDDTDAGEHQLVGYGEATALAGVLTVAANGGTDDPPGSGADPPANGPPQGGGPAGSGAIPADGSGFPSKNLALTGATVLPLIAAGAGLLALGTAWLLATRRARRESPPEGTTS